MGSKAPSYLVGRPPSLLIACEVFWVDFLAPLARPSSCSKESYWLSLWSLEFHALFCWLSPGSSNARRLGQCPSQSPGKHHKSKQAPSTTKLTTFPSSGLCHSCLASRTSKCESCLKATMQQCIWTHQNSLSDFKVQSLRLSNSTLTKAAFHQACLKWSWQSLYTNPHNVHQPRHALNKYLFNFILQYTVVYLWLTYVPRTWPELVISDSMGPKPNWDLWIPQNKALSEELLFSLMAPQGSGTIKSSPSSDCHVCPIVSWVIYATDYSSCNFNAKWMCEMSDMLHNMCIIVHASYSHTSSWSSLPVGSVARPELMSWNVPTLNIMLLRLHV